MHSTFASRFPIQQHFWPLQYVKYGLIWILGKAQIQGESAEITKSELIYSIARTREDLGFGSKASGMGIETGVEISNRLAHRQQYHLAESRFGTNLCAVATLQCGKWLK
jgi:hypothetical protein